MNKTKRYSTSKNKINKIIGSLFPKNIDLKIFINI